MNTFAAQNVQILRFVAAALVLITHISFYIQDRLDPAAPTWSAGVAGVSLFFVISGFVMQVSSAKLRRDAAGASYFLRRRLARILPLYWAATTVKIAIVLSVPALAVYHRPTLEYALGSYALVPMWDDQGLVQPIHGVGWTLFHEMYFYYLFAIALLLRQSPLLFCGSIIGLMYVLGWFLPLDSAIARVCCDQINLLFVAGLIIGHALDRGIRLPRPVVWLVIGFWTLLAMHAVAALPAVICRDVGAVLIVYAAASWHIQAVPRTRRLLAGLGDSSYSLYLIHPIFALALCVALWKAHIRFEPVLFVIVFLASIIAGHWTYRFVERPLNHAARRLLQPAPPPPVP
jgi:exopolysaccharide production protein ExoZ